jgi:hypothetical protein
MGGAGQTGIEIIPDERRFLAVIKQLPQPGEHLIKGTQADRRAHAAGYLAALGGMSTIC